MSSFKTRARGGKWNAGFWAGFAGTMLSPVTNMAKGYYAKVAASAMVAGTVSVISGGKFANGAFSGAFRFMFNDVYLCKTPVNGVTIVDHHWIKTDTLERGMWNDDDIVQWYDDVPFFAQVAVRNEPYHPEALCKLIPYVDENLVNEQLKS